MAKKLKLPRFGIGKVESMRSERFELGDLGPGDVCVMKDEAWEGEIVMLLDAERSRAAEDADDDDDIVLNCPDDRVFCLQLCGPSAGLVTSWHRSLRVRPLVGLTLREEA